MTRAHVPRQVGDGGVNVVRGAHLYRSRDLEDCTESGVPYAYGCDSRGRWSHYMPTSHALKGIRP